MMTRMCLKQSTSCTCVGITKITLIEKLEQLPMTILQTCPCPIWVVDLLPKIYSLLFFWKRTA